MNRSDLFYHDEEEDAAADDNGDDDGDDGLPNSMYWKTQLFICIHMFTLCSTLLEKAKWKTSKMFLAAQNRAADHSFKVFPDCWVRLAKLELQIGKR